MYAQLLLVQIGASGPDPKSREQILPLPVGEYNHIPLDELLYINKKANGEQF
jgi:hypothetical protein